MMLKTLFAILLLVATIPQFGNGQISPRPTQPPKQSNNADREEPPALLSHERFYTGGNVMLQFGSRYAFFELSPQLGYLITPNLRYGIGISYDYFRTRTFNGPVSENIPGVRTFANYQLFERFLVCVEMEKLRRTVFNPYSGLDERIWINNKWVGVGYRTYFSDRSGIDVQLLLDLEYTPGYDIYQYNPTFKTNIFIGL